MARVSSGFWQPQVDTDEAKRPRAGNPANFYRSVEGFGTEFLRVDRLPVFEIGGNHDFPHHCLGSARSEADEEGELVSLAAETRADAGFGDPWVSAKGQFSEPVEWITVIPCCPVHGVFAKVAAVPEISLARRRVHQRDDSGCFPGEVFDAKFVHLTDEKAVQRAGADGERDDWYRRDRLGGCGGGLEDSVYIEPDLGNIGAAIVGEDRGDVVPVAVEDVGCAWAGGGDRSAFYLQRKGAGVSGSGDDADGPPPASSPGEAPQLRIVPGAEARTQALTVRFSAPPGGV